MKLQYKLSGRGTTVIIIAFIVFVIITVIFLILFYRSLNAKITANNTNSLQADNNSLDFEPENGNQDRIALPAITGLYMKSGQTKQVVDFFNPSENNCYFKICLYLSDGTLIYESNLIEPSERITNISLLKQLQRGKYKNCRMVYNCYSLDTEAPLNNCEVKLEINSQ